MPQGVRHAEKFGNLQLSMCDFLNEWPGIRQIHLGQMKGHNMSLMSSTLQKTVVLDEKGT